MRSDAHFTKTRHCKRDAHAALCRECRQLRAATLLVRTTSESQARAAPGTAPSFAAGARAVQRFANAGARAKLLRKGASTAVGAWSSIRPLLPAPLSDRRAPGVRGLRAASKLPLDFFFFRFKDSSMNNVIYCKRRPLRRQRSISCPGTWTLSIQWSPVAK